MQHLAAAQAEFDAHMREYEKLLGEKTQLEKTAEKELKLQAELEEQSEIENFTIQVLNLLKKRGRTGRSGLPGEALPTSGSHLPPDHVRTG
jgi:hypothetical protein